MVIEPAKSYRPRISACIVTYHEEQVIERCLKSLQGVVDEIIVIHDGPCKDNTLKIARRFTEHVFEAPRIGNPEPHRILSFEKASGDWILVIDSDEFLSELLRKNLRKLVLSGQADQYQFLWPLWDGSKYVTRSWPHRVGLVKKTSLRFLAILHPDWSIDGPMMAVPYRLEHRPTYNNYTWKTFQTKWLRWRKLHAQQILTPISQIPQFQFDETHFVKHIEWIKKYDAWAAPFIFCYFLAGTIVLAPKWESLTIYKFAFLQACYYFVLSLEVRGLKASKAKAMSSF